MKQSAAVILLCFGSGLDLQNSALVLNIYLYQKARQQFRRTNIKFPTIGNTCSLAAILRSYLILIFVLILFSCKEPLQKVIDRYPNGQVMTEYIYLNKKDTSSYTEKVYYESGKLKYETDVVSNLFSGEKRTYYENGKLQRLEKLFRPTPLNDSTYDCQIINYRADGSKESEYQYVNNVINGLWTDYDSTGKKIRTAEYINGKMNGRETIYFSNQKIKSIAFVKNDTLKGFQIDFNENGDTLKWFHNGEYGFNGIFYKKWLNNGLILTGHHGDRDRTFVVWKWWDKSNKLVKSQIVRSKNEEYPAPE
jgi:antitoxin component YwqK of YwqJK toxin-antitoxin module